MTYNNNQEIKADGGKIKPTLVPTKMIYDIAKIKEYDNETLKGIRPVFIRKTVKKKKNWQGLFICPFCGKEFETLISNAMSGKVRSCGCAKGKLSVKAKGTHGESSTRLYHTYIHILDRCNNPKCKEYKWYGARGIKCEFENYEEFRNFALANGYTDELTVERNDVNGNYCKENISFIPLELQAQNTRSSVKISYKGLTLCAEEWGRILGINGDTLTRRKRSGWSDEKTIGTPVKDSVNISLVPIEIIRAIRETRLYGIKKYGVNECWKSVEVQRYRDALYRHLLKYIDDPYGVDEESGLPHIYHIACNCAFLCELEKGNFKDEQFNEDNISETLKKIQHLAVDSSNITDDMKNMMTELLKEKENK